MDIEAERAGFTSLIKHQLKTRVIQVVVLITCLQEARDVVYGHYTSPQPVTEAQQGLNRLSGQAVTRVRENVAAAAEDTLNIS